LKKHMTGPAGSWACLAVVSTLALSLAAAPLTPVLAQEAVAPARLTLAEALARSAAADPAAPATEARLRAGEAGVRQADVRPNPTLGLMVENLPSFGGGGIADRTEATLTYEQRLERGGDRPARVSLARAEAAVVQAEALVRRLDRLEMVQRAWAEALAAQAELQIAAERLELADRFQSEVQRRVEMARDPLFAGARAEAELAQAQIDFDQAGINARLTRATLSRFWTGAADFTLESTDFTDTSASRAVAGDVAEADLTIFVAQREIAGARVRVEQARATPDATVSVGVRSLWDDGAVGLVVGGSIPLGRYDRNEGAIDRARAEGLAAEGDLAAARQERERDIARHQVLLASRALEARRIQDETLPLAERAVALVREGFNRGGFTYNDVISAQRALLETRARRVAVLKQFHIDRARLDRLTGAHADLLGLETQP
jgi:cobalt-zinc-cadmium efflux system outer membrane protein